MYFSRKFKVTHVLHGVPIVFVRALSFDPFRKYKTFSYIRSTIVSDNSRRRHLPAILRKFFNAFPMTKAYVADYFFCIDDSTKKYIDSFYSHCSGSRVRNIGSIYSYNIFMKKSLLRHSSQKGRQEVENVCFLSSAFAWHGDMQASDEQVKMLGELLKKIQLFNLRANKTLRLILKLHPRDSVEPYRSLIEQDGLTVIDELNIEELDDSYCFVSVLSTLSYELSMAGFRSLYLCNDFFMNKYEEWYEKNNIVPLSVFDKSAIEEISNSVIIEQFPILGESSPQKLLAFHLLNSVDK